MSVGLVAVVTGIALSLAIENGPRRLAAADASDSPTSSSSEAASQEPSDEPSTRASASPSPTTRAPTSAEPETSPVAAIATPAATAAPTTPPACCEVLGWDIEGAWLALPPMPDPERWAISDVLMLDDGTLVVVRWPTDPEQADPSERVLGWSEAASDWIPIRTEPIASGTDAQFAQAGDGRIYSYDNVIDPSTTPWTAEPFALADPSETYAGYGLDGGSDGRIYRPATSPIDRAILESYDPFTERRQTSLPLPGIHGTCVLAGPNGLVHLLDMVAFASYDPSTGSWSGPVSTPGDRDCVGAGIGPDGRLYLASMWSGTDIFAWDFRRETWLSVEPPDVVGAFRPRFVTGPNGHLWAVDTNASFVLVPPEG